MAGLIGAVVAAYALPWPWPEPWREAGPLAVVLIVALIGLLAELASLVGRSRAIPPGPRIPDDARPADGVVGIVPMAGVRGAPNACDPRFHRFESRDAPASPPDRTAEDARATPPLLGRIVLISVFIGKDRHAWSEAEIARAHASMLRAGVWIEREAIRWGAPVNLNLSETYFVADDDRPDDVEIDFAPQGGEMQPFEAHAVTKALAVASRAATRLGFRDAVAMIEEVNPRFLAADARVWLLHPRQAGHSHAIPLDDTELSGVSLAVCYAREASFPEPLVRPPYTDPVTIVHELLHLFGASDKYGVSLRSFPPATVTTRDIMRLDESSLSRARIDPMTAREIGWVSL